MTACPRCHGALELQREGTLRDAHGVFVPDSAFRSANAYAASAALRASLASAAATGFPCPSCRGALREARIGEMSADGCAECGGWWFDRDELEKLRTTMLSRPASKPRVVGGYGGTTAVRAPHPWGPAAEGLFALLNGAGAFR